MEFLGTEFFDSMWSWIFSNGVRIVAIIVVAFIAQLILRRVVENAVRKFIKQGRGSKEAEEKRENTLIQVMNGALVVVIWAMVLLMVLSEFGVAIGPLLAAAGVVGLAVGFGGQYIIRDLFTGVFILLENQYRAGDIVTINSNTGVVEHVTLRMTTIRDVDGTVHHIPHGEITMVSNLSKEFSRVNLTMGISYDADLEKVIGLVNEVGTALSEDKEWKEQVRTAPQFVRVDDFADSSVMIKIAGETNPGKQWAVTGELRKRLKIAFDKAGVEIPFPQMVVHKAEH